MTKVVKPVWPAGYVLKSPYARIWYSDHRIPFLDILATRTAMGVVSLGWPIKGSWIEIGCGPGGLLPTILRQANLVAGVDIDEPSLEDASSLTRSMFGATCSLRASAYTLPFRSSSLDGVIAMETLEHLETEPAVGEISRILKPGGKLVFSVPVETGSALLVRQALRRLMQLKNSSFSPMGYSFADLAGMVLGKDKKLHKLKRSASASHHLYFSYKVFLDEFDHGMRLERLSWSPCPIRGPWTFSLMGLAIKR